MNNKIFIVLLGLILACALSQTTDSFKNVVLQDVNREVDAQTQLLRIETTIDLKNEGETPLRDFYFAVSAEQVETLRLFIVRDNYDNSEAYSYKITENLKIKSEYNATLYKIELDPPVKAGATKKLRISETHWGRMQPLPKHISTQEDQKMILEDNLYFFTPYTVVSQSTTYKLTATPLSYTDDDGKVRGSTLDYRFPSTVSGFQRRPNRIHFDNNTPFVIFTEIVKTIEVSHWGNIYVEESYKLENQGAEFKGEYSRVDFSPHDRNTGKNALRGLSARYPVHAWGMHYRDEVGNISTSRAWRDSSNVNLQITPRFVVFGGWSSNWVISYNLPTNYYLFTKSDDTSSFVLKQNFGSPFGNILAEKYTVKVILPEGAEVPKVELPFALDRETQVKTFSYLDYEGRPTLILEKANVLDYHNKEMIVTYKFDGKNMLTEPALLFGFFLVVFLVAILIGRIDFSFNQKKSKVKSS
jgi:oligosaccharyltransferase complex subunit alpha (ribophorin I)